MTIKDFIFETLSDLRADIVEGWIDLRDSLKSKKTRRETIGDLIGGVALAACIPLVVILFACIPHESATKLKKEIQCQKKQKN